MLWFRPDGSAMEEGDWAESFAKSMSVFLDGDRIDDSFLLLFNGHAEMLGFSLSVIGDHGGRGEVVVDTTSGFLDPGSRFETAGSQVKVEGRSLVVIRFPPA